MKENEKEKLAIVWDFNGKFSPIVFEEIIGFCYCIIAMLLTMNFIFSFCVGVVSFGVARYSKEGKIKFR